MTSRIMQPTAASTLGIIAIAFITITATASEAENSGAIGLDINHPGGRSTEEDHRHFPDGERRKNNTEGEKVTVWPRSNVTTTATLANIETKSSSASYTKKRNFEVITTTPLTMITTMFSLNPIRVKEPVVVDKERAASASELLEDEDSVARLQRDQSKAEAIARIHDDPTHEPAVTITPMGSHQRIPDDMGTTSIGDFTMATSLESRSENSVTVKASLLAPSRLEDPFTRIDEQEPASSSSSSSSLSSNAKSNELHRSSRLLRLRLQEEEEEEETDQEDQGSHFESSSLPVASVLATESIERKDLNDIRAISFQVPRPQLAEEVDDEKQESLGKLARSNANTAVVAAAAAAAAAPAGDGVPKIDDSAKKLGEGRKDRSRAMNELPPGNEKSTKAFYEIKPSVKTELEKKNETRRLSITTSTQKTLLGGKFVLPSVDSAIGKFGPYFVDGDQEVNVTARIGSTVGLDCKIGLLGDKKVTWVQQDKDSFRLLTVGRTPYSVDQRISLHYRYPSNWRLQILYASPRDSGLYKCQVTTHPPLVKKINVIVTAPLLTITDDSGRIVAKERHLKAGSALRLRCEARDVLESQNETVVWTRGDETLTEDVSENRTTEMTEGKEVLVIVSTLIVERASPRHAGNYSCVVPGIAKTTIAVHVLNGELPAAVHDGNGVSRAVLNLWFIHLTVSYVFFR